MALEPINPLIYKRFTEILAGTVIEITDLMEDHRLGSWWNTLQRYQFNGMNYLEGQNVRNCFHKQLVQAERPDERLCVANRILEWGKMPLLSASMERSLNDSLNALNNENTGIFDYLYSNRIASISKVYEMWNPALWVIFDSYCARGLQWLVGELWKVQGHEKHSNVLKIPWPPGRVGRPCEGFPHLGSVRQAKLGFLYSSWLCRAIANQLNQVGNQPIVWKAYHVEMVAFQIGHEV